MVIKFKCEYNGKDFCGFQRQSRGRSVQSVLEDAISKYLGEKVTIAASGRTDAGVHARAQVCSFETENDKLKGQNQMFKLCTAVNAFLPCDVAVRDFEIAPDGFHARFSAKAKTYLYRVYVNPHRSPLRDGHYLQIYKTPYMETLYKDAKSFVGRRDFRDFTTQSGEKDCVREIYRFDVEEHGDEIWFWVTGNGFLRNMVRIMIGSLLNEKNMKKTAPAKGLTLWEVEY